MDNTFWRHAIIATLILATAVTLPLLPQDKENDLRISDVSISRPQFNPSNGEKVAIHYSLNQDATIMIRIYDPDCGLIKYLVNNKKVKKGANQEIWDGRDQHNDIVPDEAYFFTVTAHNKKIRTTYDPAAFSGGEEIYVDTADFDQESGTISYFLKNATRIIFRAGIDNGPLLITLEDWKARPKGENTVYWTGLDKTGKIRIAAQPNFKMTIGGFQLPENSIITYGNNKLTYFEYKEKGKPQDTKERVHLKKEGVEISRHYFIERARDRSPRVDIQFPSIEKNGDLPELKGRVITRIDLDPEDKKYFTMNQFELLFAVDGQYFMEETNGYVPYNWVWDTTQFPDGEHFLTVNAVSLNDQIGASSVKVMIQNAKKN